MNISHLEEIQKLHPTRKRIETEKKNQIKEP